MKEIQKEEIQSSVDTYKVNKALKLNVVNKGESIDNVLVHGVDNEVKSVPRSEFGGGSQTLQQLFDNTPTAAQGSYTSPDATNESVLSVAANDRESHALFDSKYGTYSGTIGILDGKTTLTQGSVGDGVSLATTTVGFENPLVNTTLNLPAPTVVGNYTLATTTDIATKLDRNDSSVGYPRVYAARGNGTQTMYNLQTSPIITSPNNVNAVPNTQVVKDYIDIPASATVIGVVNNVPLQELGGTDKLINNIRIGKGSGTGEENTVLGENALTVNTSSYNTAVGFETLAANTTAESNTAIGNWALKTNTTGGFNTAIGSSALELNITGTQNIAIGSSALSKNQFGSYNIAIGVGALSSNIGNAGSNIDGVRCVAIGGWAMYQNTTGNGIAIGEFALSSQTTGMYNVVMGWQAGSGITTGQGNTIIAGTGFVGKGGGITTGNNNLIIAPNNGNTTGITTGSGNVVVGKISGLSATSSNTVVIADGIGGLVLRKNTNGEILAPNLTNALITSGGDQSLITKKYLESKVQVVDNTTISVLSLATLNSTYSTFSIGSKVQCMSITAGALIYEKTLTGWAQHSVTTVQ
jgi:hypothetical protein